MWWGFVICLWHRESFDVDTWRIMSCPNDGHVTCRLTVMWCPVSHVICRLRDVTCRLRVMWCPVSHVMCRLADMWCVHWESCDIYTESHVACTLRIMTCTLRVMWHVDWESCDILIESHVTCRLRVMWHVDWESCGAAGQEAVEGEAAGQCDDDGDDGPPSAWLPGGHGCPQQQWGPHLQWEVPVWCHQGPGCGQWHEVWTVWTWGLDPHNDHLQWVRQCTLVCDSVHLCVIMYTCMW